MKLNILFPLVISLCVSCNFLDNSLYSGPPRRDTHNRDRPEGNHQGNNPKDTIAIAQIDTLLFYSSVEFDKSYDWSRDSSYKKEPFSVSYYQNHQKLFTLNSSANNCISPDADTHHIIDGDLYTEASDRQKTYIGKNGETILIFDSRQYLNGLLTTRDGSIYTLASDRDGEGFSLRKENTLIFRRDTGKIFGGFEDSSYGPTGALYLDLGRVTFCYKTGTSSKSHYYVVYDAVEESLDAENRDIDDIKIKAGKVFFSPQDQGGYTIQDARIWTGVQSMPVSGYFYGRNDDFYGLYPSSAGRFPVKLSKTEAHIFCLNDYSFAAYNDPQGSVVVNDSKGMCLTFEDCYLPREDCITYFDNNIILGLSQKKSQSYPFIYLNGEKKEIPINGCICAVAVETRITS